MESQNILYSELSSSEQAAIVQNAREMRAKFMQSLASQTWQYVATVLHISNTSITKPA